MEMNDQQTAILNVITDSIERDLVQAREYAKVGCKQCNGKGHFSRDHILPGRARSGQEKVTPAEVTLCFCVEKNLKKKIIKNGL